MRPFDQLDPWEMLGLAAGATTDEIRRAYERLSSRLAPGSLSLYSITDREEQLDVQQRLRAAYVELLDRVTPEAGPMDARGPGTPAPSSSVAVAPVPAPPGDEATAVQPSAAHPETDFTGELLRRSREAKGLSLETLSHHTRIRTRLLESLEAERFDQLPERVFVRGFVLAVARELGLDAELVWAGYGKRWEAWAATRR
ncbi:MAG: helix-turn-helix domain-containing protein [Acidobacteriia bacterium]|nr:helix-turn-helix domain-containing protein [Terriglobia bacterium]